MDTAYERAQLRREELRRELDEIDLFLKLHQKFSSGTETERTVTTDTETEASALSVPQAKSQIPDRKRNLPKHQMATIVRQMILDRRQPMTRTDIVEALELKGIPVAGQDQSKAIGTIMWRLREKFANIPGLGYWPADVPFKAAGATYEPAVIPAPQADPRGDMFGPLPATSN